MKTMKGNASRSFLMGFGSAAICGAKVGPIDIAPEVFAADAPTGGSLDFNASIHRYTLHPGFPLADDYRGNAYRTRKLTAAAVFFEVCFEFHDAKFSLRRNLCQ